MSYDLMFSSRGDASTLGLESFRRYFEARPNYTIEDSQAWYSNDDTGVYFSFDYDEESVPSLAAFNINFNRPRFFGMEAAPEVEEFVRTFDLLVDDPQIDGMGLGEFTLDGFLTGWQHGNRWAVRSMVAQSPPITYHGEQLREIWRWNFERARLQDGLGEKVFVPVIGFGLVNGKARSLVVWTDALPAVIPPVDTVVIARNQLAKRGLLGRHKMEFARVEWSLVEKELVQYPLEEGPMPYRMLKYSDPPASLVEFFKKQRALKSPEDLNVVALDSVLDRELLDED